MDHVKDTIKLLRFPFSVFLLPVSLFSFYYIHPEINLQFFLLLFIWHVLVFPSSNGYNSYHDDDEGPIGGIAAPPKPTKLLLQIANFLDGTAILLSLLVDVYFAVFVFVYILISRLYSNRNIRLKKYPIIGFFVVFIFQGAWVFCANIVALSPQLNILTPPLLYAAIACSFLIGTMYPLTQIYQHEADTKDGVRTLSILLGKRGTFLFSGLMFGFATLFLYLSFRLDQSLNNFWLFHVVMFPATLFFLIWAIRSFRKEEQVNFKNTMIMLVLSSILNNLYFLILLIH